MIYFKIIIYYIFLFYFNAHALNINEKEKTISLNIAITHSGTNNYYLDLISKLLQSGGYKVKYEIAKQIPQPRIVHEFEKGNIDLYWFLSTPERNSKFLPIEFYIDKKMTGHRVFLIQKGSQSKFNSIYSLLDLQNSSLIAGLGEAWYDAKVWDLNNLKVRKVPGDWNKIYSMLSKSKEVDYFPRSILEINKELELQSMLEEEKNLVLIYDNGVKFYLNRNHEQSEKFKQIIEAILKTKDGLKTFEDVFKLHNQNYLNLLNLDSRRKIYLKIAQ